MRRATHAILPLALVFAGCAAPEHARKDAPESSREPAVVPPPGDDFSELRRELDARIAREARVERDDALEPPPVAGPAPAPTSPDSETREDAPAPTRRPGERRTVRGGGDVGRLSPELRILVEKLQHPDPKVATESYWHLAEIDPRHVYELIGLIESDEKTMVKRLTILVKDPTFLGYYASKIPGMGRMETIETISEEGALVTDRVSWRAYDGRLKCGVAPNGKGYRVIMDRAEGFPVGIVVRAALLNRFRSGKYPSGIDHTRELRRWWHAYYDIVFGRSGGGRRSDSALSGR